MTEPTATASPNHRSRRNDSRDLGKSFAVAIRHGLERCSGSLHYEHLQRVRTHGSWEEWLDFFLEGVTAVASSATSTARRIRDLVDHDRVAVQAFGRGAASALRVHDLAAHRIVLTAAGTSQQLGLSVPTVNAALARLEQAGILHEVTGRKRGRLFVYEAYLDLLQAET